MDLQGRAVGVIGAATAGAEVAARLAEQGATVVVFEQNPRPYGKIEDGLPRWHGKQRRKEYKLIDERLAHDNILYVPCTRFGQDIGLDELEHRWGFHRVVFALGAWRDRPLRLDGSSPPPHGLIYQNELIYWFNHFEEARYTGPKLRVTDGAIVVGGGLASIDVAKVLMFCVVGDALAERGLAVDLFEMEHRGIPPILAEHGLPFADLGLRGATLYYRKRREDMPLVDMPERVDEARQAKIFAARRRLADKAMNKYLFSIEALMRPEAILAEHGRVRGVRFQPMARSSDGGFQPVGAPVERCASLVISSIGSIPETLAGVPMNGELFDFDVVDPEREIVRLGGHPSVFLAGNAVTGRGNIVASRKHAEKVSAVLASELTKVQPHGPEFALRLRQRVEQRWAAIDYPGDYSAWITSVGPAE